MSVPPETGHQRVGVIIMAAGLGKRMQSKYGKVLHPVAGRPMVTYAVELAERFGDAGVALVVGHQGDRVREALKAKPDLHIVDQPTQLGTGHAVMQARPVFDEAGSPDVYLILNGDTPLLQEEMIRELLDRHRSDGATVTILTAMLEDPAGYGRVVRGATASAAVAATHAAVLRIVEDKDTSPEEAALGEINVGTYAVDGRFLFSALDKLQPNNAQGEYYLTDIVSMAVSEGRRVSAVRLHDSADGLGVNTRVQLAEAERVLRDRIRARWMAAGVTMLDPATTWIDATVQLGRDTTLYPHVTLEGSTTIGEDCRIRSQTRLTNCVLKDRVDVLDCCVLTDALLEEEVVVGPFVHLRPGTVARRRAKIGNFVEMKKAELGESAKANHLSYLGDAVIGRGVNIGAGTITCNYDGAHKYRTIIEDDVFIGSDTQLVAPVTVGRGALIAAGTTVTQDVPADALVISRIAQTVRPGWAANRRQVLKGEVPQAPSTPASTRSSAASASSRKKAGLPASSKKKKTKRRA